MRVEDGFSSKPPVKSLFLCQTDWSGNDPAGQFWQMESALRVVSSFSRVDANYKQQRTFKFFVNFVLKLILFPLFSGSPWLAHSPPERATWENSFYKTIPCLYKDKDSNSIRWGNYV